MNIRKNALLLGCCFFLNGTLLPAYGANTEKILVPIISLLLSNTDDTLEQETCSATSLNYCNTETTCGDAGGYWYNDQCNSSEKKTCSATSLDYCYTESECEYADGLWHNDNCYGTLLSEAGFKWLNKNLGATRVAQSYDDEEAYGDLYQWGRGTDGHEKRDSGTIETASTSDTPDHSSFIYPGTYHDWRYPHNDELWQGVDGINNPCPSGFRLPTPVEWDAENDSWGSSYGAEGAYDALRLTLAGGRGDVLYNAGSRGEYWTSTTYFSDTAYRMQIDATHSTPWFYTFRNSGFSVRCIQD